MMDSFLPPGTILIFDDFSDSLHQYRAFMDYCSAYRKAFNVIGLTRSVEHVAAQIK